MIEIDIKLSEFSLLYFFFLERSIEANRLTFCNSSKKEIHLESA